MLKFGIFTYRNGEFQVDDIDDLFSFLCHILDIFTNRKDFMQYTSLDQIMQKDANINDYTQNNPIQKAVYDLKYQLLNKKDWSGSQNQSNSRDDNSDENQKAADNRDKLINEIMEIFHFMLDLRQNYLMANIVEMFHKRIFRKYDPLKLAENEKYRKKCMNSMIKDFKKILPESDNFTQEMSYNFPSLDDMYENKDFEDYRKIVQNMDIDIDMHDELLILFIDTFNVSTHDKYQQQNTLTLICRYYSERSELVRNIERMMLVFNEEEWRIYQWVNTTIDEFTRVTEKALLWLDDLQEINEEEYIERANDLLLKLKRALYYKFEVYTDEATGQLEFKHLAKTERKLNKFTQRVYRSVKVYDHLINFFDYNMNLFKYVRT